MKMMLSGIAILFSSSLAMAVCPYAKNLQANVEVGMFNTQSNAYYIKKTQPQRSSHDPRSVDVRD